MSEKEVLNIKCPHCRHTFRMVRKVPASAPVLDLVFHWSSAVMVDSRPMVAGMPDEQSLVLALPGEHGPIFLSVELGVPMPHQDGEMHAFQLVRLAASVLKLVPSVVHGGLHAYVTIVDCPEEPLQLSKGDEG